MLKNCKYFAVVLLAVCSFCLPVEAAKSKIKGDPELIWLSPLGSSNIENNAYNRCRLIRTIKPGVGEASKAQKNNYDILSNYVSNLYAQSIKISAYISSESEKSENASTADLSNEKAVIEQEITRRLSDISRRMNIINSFEAGTMMLSALWNMNRLPPTTYSEFRALKDGKYDYVTECEVLKK